MKHDHTTTHRLVRTGPLPEGPAYTAAAEAFAATVTDPVTLVVRRRAGAVTDLVVATTATPATMLAGALGAQAEQAPTPDPLPGASAVAVVAGDGVAGRTTLTGTDPAGVAARTAAVLGEGEEVVVHLARMSACARRRVRAWSAAVPGDSDHFFVRSNNPLVATVTATAATPSRARELLTQVLSPLPGWDVRTTATTGDRKGVGAALVVVGLAGAIGSLLVPTAPYAWAPLAVRAAALLALLAGVLAILVPSPAARWAASGYTLRAPLQTGLPRSPWPLARTTFPTAAALVACLAAPQAGAASGASVAAARTVPPVLRTMRGMVVADSVRLDPAVAWGGLAVVGAPGTGKSVLLRGAFANALVDRETHPSAVVAVESKPDGLASYAALARATGHEREVATVVMADPTSLQVDMFARAGDDPFTRAAFTVDALAASMGEGAIMGRSREVLSALISAGMVTTPATWAAYTTAGGQPVHRSWLGAALVLAGRLGEESARALYAALADGAADPVVARAYNGLGIIWGPGTTTASRRTLVEAARNKLDMLAPLAHALAPAGALTWEQVLSSCGVVVVGTGPSPDGRHQMDGAVTEVLTALVGYTLRAAVERTCFGWQAAGRAVWVMCDEFKHLAGAWPRAATWWRDDGRSYGVRPVFATQYLEQLGAISPSVLTSFLGYATFVSFRQDNLQAAEAVARQLSRDGSAWSASDVATLPRWHMAVATSAAGVSLPAFTVPALDVSGDPDGYVARLRA